MQNEEGYFVVPYDAELECKQNIVVYDSNTSTLREPEGRHFMHTLLFSWSYYTCQLVIMLINVYLSLFVGHRKKN